MRAARSNNSRDVPSLGQQAEKRQGLGLKKPERPPEIVAMFAAHWPNNGVVAVNCESGGWVTRRQNSSRRGKRCPGALPAIRLALMAPIEVPITQSGSMPASHSASQTPTW